MLVSGRRTVEEAALTALRTAVVGAGVVAELVVLLTASAAFRFLVAGAGAGAAMGVDAPLSFASLMAGNLESFTFDERFESEFRDFAGAVYSKSMSWSSA